LHHTLQPHSIYLTSTQTICHSPPTTLSLSPPIIPSFSPLHILSLARNAHTTQQHNTLQSLTHSTGYTLTTFLMRLYLIPSVTLQLHSLSISYATASQSLMQPSLRSTTLVDLCLSCNYLGISHATTFAPSTHVLSHSMR
jgi:hypothetical protein